MDLAPAFIICAPRSGTTWLTRALGSHPEVFATEVRAFGEHADFVHDAGAARPRLRITMDRYVDALLAHHLWQGLDASRESMQDDLVRRFYEAIQEQASSRSHKLVFVDKVTPYAGTSEQTVHSIERLFPKSRVILLMRDGRDVAVSGIMHWLGRTLEGHELTSEQIGRRAFFARESSAPLERFFTDAELMQWAAHWREPIEAVVERAQRLQTLTVRYEDMSRDAGHELARICRFLGVAHDRDAIDRAVAASSFEVMSGGRRRGEDAPGAHVRKGVVGDWKTYFTRADGRLFQDIAGRTLVECGYERDDSWVGLLPERLSVAHP